jgi:hypothetical protein
MAFNNKLETKHMKNACKKIKACKPNATNFKSTTQTIWDYKKCTDFQFTLSDKTYNVAFRMREFFYSNSNDITIRAKTKYNQPTEINKIQTVKRTCYFYGFESYDGNGIDKFIFFRINDKIQQLIAQKEVIFNEFMATQYLKFIKTGAKSTTYKGVFIVLNKANNKYDGTGFITLTFDEIKSCDAIICSNKI